MSPYLFCFPIRQHEVSTFYSKEHTELFDLPRYRPELNPEEQLNANLERAMAKRFSARTQTT